MNVKTVVKVMNFHALLRVEASRRQAEMHMAMQDELAAMMRIILNNRNLRLDKRIRMPDPKAPVLRIYLGSDLGFCGSVNASVSAVIRQDERAEKIVVGKKLRRPAETSLFLTQEQYRENFDQVRAYLERAVRQRPWSAVELVYNHYYNFSSIKQEIRRIYPLEPQGEETDSQWDDFFIEDDVDTLLEDMTISYLVYELRLAADNAYAAENVMRQNATSESLKKLDEMEEDQRRQTRKAKNQAAFQKTIDNFTKQRTLEEA